MATGSGNGPVADLGAESNEPAARNRAANLQIDSIRQGRAENDIPPDEPFQWFALLDHPRPVDIEPQSFFGRP